MNMGLTSSIASSETPRSQSPTETSESMKVMKVSAVPVPFPGLFCKLYLIPVFRTCVLSTYLWSASNEGMDPNKSPYIIPDK